MHLFSFMLINCNELERKARRDEKRSVHVCTHLLTTLEGINDLNKKISSAYLDDEECLGRWLMNV